MPIKILTLNLCLGLKNKKFLVKKMLKEHECKDTEPLYKINK